jgi:hypothetical protein
VYTYAPVIKDTRFELVFGGRYVLRDGKPAVIDGRKVASGRSVELAAGAHTIDREGARLQWHPASSVQKRLDPKLRREGRRFDRISVD